jgi:hypothetical protein
MSLNKDARCGDIGSTRQGRLLCASCGLLGLVNDAPLLLAVLLQALHLLNW